MTQQLYSLTLLAEGWRRLAHNGKLDAQTDYLAELGAIAQQALKEMRPPGPRVRPYPPWNKTDYWAHFTNASRPSSAGRESKHASWADDLLDLPSPIEEEMYGIIQEALINNTLEHTAATTVTVRVGIVGQRSPRRDQ